MTEKNFRKHVIKYLKDKGALVFPQEGQAVGTPDLFVLYKSKFIAIELKGSTLSDGSKSYYRATPAQLFRIDKINKHGGYATVLKHDKDWRHNIDLILCGNWEFSVDYSWDNM